tara:strand:- start:397 stop:816 length:420 start_codon:yes stop_codon:yes gene_type:complete
MAEELVIEMNAYKESVKALKKLLAKKDKLVSQKGKGNRNQYQIEINKLKKDIKRTSGGSFSFGKVLKDVKKQEREGKFDRGAEGKTKKKLRAKMGQEREELFTSGRHKESDADKYIKEKIPQYAKVPEKKKKESIAKSR